MWSTYCTCVCRCKQPVIAPFQFHSAFINSRLSSKAKLSTSIYTQHNTTQHHRILPHSNCSTLILSSSHPGHSRPGKPGSRGGSHCRSSVWTFKAWSPRWVEKRAYADPHARRKVSHGRERSHLWAANLSRVSWRLGKLLLLFRGLSELRISGSEW